MSYGDDKEHKRLLQATQENSIMLKDFKNEEGRYMKEKSGICRIVGSGDFSPDDFATEKGDLVIAADGGYRHLMSVNVAPDILVGDFDSLNERPDGIRTIEHSPIKNDTDTGLAITIGVEEGYSRFVIYGGTGGKRPEHTIANIQTLIGLEEKGFCGYIVGNGNIITVVRNRTLTFPEDMNGYISVFSIGEYAGGVSLKGFKYEISEAVLKNSHPLGVSNEFTNSEAVITVSDGTLLVMWHDEKTRLIW